MISEWYASGSRQANLGEQKKSATVGVPASVLSSIHTGKRHRDEVLPDVDTTLKPLPLWSFSGAVYNPKKPEEEESDKPPNEASKKNSSKKRKILPGPLTSLYAEPVLIKSLAPTTSESRPVSPALCLEDEVDACPAI